MIYFSHMAVDVIRLDALKAFVAKCGGQKAASVKLGCSPQFIGQMYHGKRNVPSAMLRKLGKRRDGAANGESK